MARRQDVSDDDARDDYFARYFSVTVDNPRDYHLMLNTDRMGLEGSTEIR